MSLDPNLYAVVEPELLRLIVPHKCWPKKNIILDQWLPMPWTGREIAGVRPKEFAAQVLLTSEERILLATRSCESFRSNEEGHTEEPFFDDRINRLPF